MKNIIKIVGIIAILAVIGFMTGCQTETEASPADQVIISISGLPDGLNGKCININLWKETSDSDPVATSFQPLTKVVNGRVSSNMVWWGKNDKAFGDEGSYIVALGVYEDEYGATKTNNQTYRAGSPKKTIIKGTNPLTVGDFSPSLEDDFPTISTPPEGTPDAEFWGTYTSPAYTSPYIETVVFSETSFRVSDNENTPEDFLAFTITKWESFSVPTEYEDIAMKGYKFTGFITAGQPVNTNIYGSQTAPGFTQADITNKTTCHMYIFTNGSGANYRFYRTTFSKETGTDSKAIVKTAAGDYREFQK